MELQKLKADIILDQKKGLPFIVSSIIVWFLIWIVTTSDIPIGLKNIYIFFCSIPMVPIAWLAGKIMGVEVFKNENPLGKLGFLFTMNQMLYLLIVMWVLNVLPEKMVMVYAMVFGSHLLPYSWLYESKAYLFFSIFITIISLIVGSLFPIDVLAILLCLTEVIFSFALRLEVKNL